jgi:hypothetical protein
LFDVTDDLTQHNNLATDAEPTVDRMRTLLRDSLTELGYPDGQYDRFDIAP